MNADLINQAIEDMFSSVDGCRLLAGDIGDYGAMLYPAERESVVKAIDRRKREFATGRMLARRVMTALDIEPGPILRGEQRQPLWPDGVTGSLTHAEEVAVAAIATPGGCRALGIDLEVASRVGTELYGKLFSEAEQAVIGDDPKRAGLMFSAKEAGYKATFALAPRFVGFKDAQTELDFDRSRFRFRYVGDHPPSSVMEHGQGYFLFCGRYVLSLFIIPES